MRFAFCLALLLILPSLLGPRPALGNTGVECWTGWGYWLEPTTQAYASERFLIVTKGPAAWLPGQPVALYVLDARKGGIREDLGTITLVPGSLRYTQNQRLPSVTGRGWVPDSSLHMAFGLNHIKQLVTGIAKLDDFYLWACGLPKRGAQG